MSASSASNWTSTGEPNQTTGQFPLCEGDGRGDRGQYDWVRLLGNNPVKKSMRAGEAEYNAARAKGYVEGGIDRVTGKKDSIVGAVTGDKSQQAEGNLRHDKGEAQQDLNRNA